LQIAFKQITSVLEVLLCVGFGSGDTVECFVEDAQDALLFGEWWEGISIPLRTLTDATFWIAAPQTAPSSCPESRCYPSRISRIPAKLRWLGKFSNAWLMIPAECFWNYGNRP